MLTFSHGGGDWGDGRICIGIPGGGAGLYSVREMIAGIRANPHAEDYWWLYLMMFWTIVPTFIHALAYAMAAVFDQVDDSGYLPGLARRLGVVPDASSGTAFAPQSLLAPFVFLGLRLVAILWGLFVLSAPILFAIGWAAIAGFDGADLFDWLADGALWIAGAIEGWSGWPFF